MGTKIARLEDCVIKRMGEELSLTICIFCHLSRRISRGFRLFLPGKLVDRVRFLGYWNCVNYSFNL